MSPAEHSRRQQNANSQGHAQICQPDRPPNVTSHTRRWHEVAHDNGLRPVHLGTSYPATIQALTADLHGKRNEVAGPADVPERGADAWSAAAADALPTGEIAGR
ncbi:MAG TPA: hypothetical protein VGS19_26365 [Streptosporangiaceae bacterium]|nr:hypothetical protein [Streptosporangiaceae bacterium]